MKFQITLLSLLALCVHCVPTGDNAAVIQSAVAASASSLFLKDAIRQKSNPAASSSVALKASTHQSAPCESSDIMCWCLKAVKYTNDVRRENGVSTMLKVGSESQLANANKWAEKLSRDQGLEHQDFDSANREIGCGRSMSGENVAYNFESGDVARACLDQWIGSQGHFENIVRDWFEEVVVGFAFDSRGAVYCVQTFAVTDGDNGRAGGKDCEPVGSNGDMRETPEPVPKPVSEDMPTPTPEPDSDAGPKESPCPCSESDTRHRKRRRFSKPDTSPVPDSPDSLMRSGECAKDDITCWCMKAVKYTNDVRKENGVSTMLKVGSESQLANANKWAEKLSRDQGLEHQDFDSANREIGCGRRMGGENVAYNFESGDVARACLDQWIGSQGHFENIVRDWFEEVVIGFAFDSRGAVYCVQTFAVSDDNNGRSDGEGCEPVSASMETTETPEPVPEPVSEQVPQSTFEAPSEPVDEPVRTPKPAPVEKTPKPEPVEETPKPEPVEETPKPDPVGGSNPGSCEKNDTRCWCMKAVKYTNDVRRENGVGSMLKVGSESQLANANKWAEKLARDEGLEHQDFDTANGEIGCGRALGGENVAYNFESGDYARACVDQWIGSQGHFENIVRDWFLEVVVGFAFDNRGAVYCVQTFAVTDDGNGNPDGNKCGPVQM